MRAGVNRALRFPYPCCVPRRHLGLRVSHVSHRRRIHPYPPRPGSCVFRHSSSSPQRQSALTSPTVTDPKGKTELEQMDAKFKTYYDVLAKSVVGRETSEIAVHLLATRNLFSYPGVN